MSGYIPPAMEPIQPGWFPRTPGKRGGPGTWIVRVCIALFIFLIFFRPAYAVITIICAVGLFAGWLLWGRYHQPAIRGTRKEKADAGPS